MEFANKELEIKETKKQEDPDFEKWFKGSVVVDNNGRPLKVFHATTIKNFEGLNLKSSEEGDWSSWGVYFSSDRKATVDYMKQNYIDSTDRFERLLSREDSENDLISKDRTEYLNNHESNVKTFSCFIKITKPLVLENHQQLMDLYYGGATKKQLEEQYDGIIVNHDSDFTDQYVVFNPDNIKILPSDILENE
jgi:hypothetical protein